MYWAASCVFFCFIVRLLVRYGYDDAESGAILAVSSLAALTVQPALGDLADRAGSAKRLLVLSLLATAALAFLLEMFSRSFGMVCLLMFSVFGSFRSLANIIDLWSIDLGRGDASYRYGFTRSFGSVFYAAGAVVFGWLIDRFGAGIIPKLFIALVLLDALMVGLAPRNRAAGAKPASKPRPTWKALKSLLGNRAYLLFLSAYFFSEVSAVPMQNYLTRKFEILGAGDVWTGAAFLVLGLFQLPALLSIDRLGKRFEPSTLIAVSLGGIAARHLIMAFARTPLLLALSYATEPVAFGLYVGAALLHIEKILPQDVRYLGITLHAALTGGLGGLIGNALAGSLSARFGVLAMMEAMAFPSVLSCAMFGLATIRQRRKAESPKGGAGPSC